MLTFTIRRVLKNKEIKRQAAYKVNGSFDELPFVRAGLWWWRFLFFRRYLCGFRRLLAFASCRLLFFALLCRLWRRYSQKIGLKILHLLQQIAAVSLYSDRSSRQWRPGHAAEGQLPLSPKLWVVWKLSENDPKILFLMEHFCRSKVQNLILKALC